MWGDDFPVFDDIQKFVVMQVKRQARDDQIGTSFGYNRVYAAMLAAEAAKTAQGIHDTKALTNGADA